MRLRIVASCVIVGIILASYACTRVLPSSPLPLLNKANPVKIVCIGDSITYGAGGAPYSGGYRSPLKKALLEAGFLSVDFVGGHTKLEAVLNGIDDSQHYGYPGMRSDHLRTLFCGGNFDAWFKNNPQNCEGAYLPINICEKEIGSDFDPDGSFHFFEYEKPEIVILLIGANDCAQQFKNGTEGISDVERATFIATQNIAPIIDKALYANPQTWVVVGFVTPNTDPVREHFVTSLNAALVKLIETQYATKRVQLVNTHDVVLPAELPDGIHPNQSGYDKIANAFSKAILTATHP